MQPAHPMLMQVEKKQKEQTRHGPEHRDAGHSTGGLPDDSIIRRSSVHHTLGAQGRRQVGQGGRNLEMQEHTQEQEALFFFLTFQLEG